MHLKELSNLIEWLAVLGAPIDEQYQVALLLRSLPMEYELLRAAYMAKGVVQMPELHEVLITQEAHFVEQGCGDCGSESDNERALFGHSSVNCRFSGCYNCGLMDHYQRDCPVTSRGASHKRNQNQGRRDQVEVGQNFSGFAKTCDDEEEHYVF